MTSDAAFQPHLDILPPSQRRLWDELTGVPSAFVLYGGTALALRLGHRQSVDFDFFSRKTFEPREIVARMPLLAEGSITQQAPNELTVIIDRDGPVKLSFFGVPGVARLEQPAIAPGNRLQVASLLDLAGTKASVVQQRAEAKDYLDLDAILQDGRVDLPTTLAAAKAIFGQQYNPLPTLKALSFFEDGDLHRLPDATKSRLVAAAREVDPLHLPQLRLQAQEQAQEQELGRRR